MMAVFLDGNPIIDEKEDDKETVQMCYEVLFAHCYEKKRAIEKAKIDGKVIGIQEFPKYYNVPLKEIKSLEFFTIDEVDLFRKLVYLGERFAQEAGKLEEISTLINAGHDGEALTIVSDISVIMHDLLLYHRYFALFGLSLQYPIGDSNILEYKDKINSLLTNLLDAFQAKDTVEFSDLAEYELAPLIRELGENLQNLSC